MICNCELCVADAPVSDEELREVIGAFMEQPRCSIYGKAAQAAVAALVLRDLNYCSICQGRNVVTKRCPKCDKRKW